MGILNRTPDSFYDRGATFALDELVRRAEQLAHDGADLLDIGGVKAGPGPEVSEAEELDRVVPAIQQVHDRGLKYLFSPFPKSPSLAVATFDMLDSLSPKPAKVAIFAEKTDWGAELRGLWDEFDLRASREARFAAALDRLQPVLHNYTTEGGTWREHRVTRDQVVARNQPMSEGAPELWDYAKSLIDDAVARGLIEG